MPLQTLSSKERKVIQEFKEKIMENFEVVNLALFGSKARGDFRKNSDIDILLVLKNPTEKDKNKIYGLVNELLFEYNVDLSVKIFSEKEFIYFKSIPTVFTQFIEKEGIKI